MKQKFSSMGVSMDASRILPKAEKHVSAKVTYRSLRNRARAAHRATRECRVAWGLYPFVWHLALFVLGALGVSAWVSILQAS